MPDQNESLAKYVLLSVMCTSFTVPFIGSAINLALPSMGEEFHANAIMISWVITAYLLSTAALLLPLGHLADILGRRKIYLWGTVSFALISATIGLTHSIMMVILWRVLQGMAAAMIFGTGMAMLTSVYPPQKRGKVLGLSTAATYTGLSMGPILGGFMNQHLGWRSIFYVTALVALLAFTIMAKKVSGEWAGAREEGFDWKGSLVYILGLSTIIYGFSSLSEVSWAKFAALAGIVLLLIFFWLEFRAKHPILQAGLFKNNPSFTFSNLAALINYSATFALTFLLSLYLQVVSVYSSQQAGLILLVQPVMMALCSPLSGSLSDRIEPRIVASLGMSLSTLSLFGFIFLRPGFPIWALIGLQVVIGVGFGLFTSPNTNAVMSSVQPRFYGVASSTLGTMRLVGQAISMAIVTMIIAMHLGQGRLVASNAPNLVAAMRTSFIIFTVLCLLGVFASLARGQLRPTSATSTDN
ncbi:MAG TPA: MFS transporter [Syntrophomonadaceae bacterium]|nr:MFS transporter [Syntrophomonadaceae bacterium]